MRVTKERAYAKINLFLDVTKKRGDGYHEIRTVMHRVSIYDELTIALVPSRTREISLTVVNNPHLPRDRSNLAYRAAELFLDHTGLSYSVDIRLSKLLPVGAGLAGGSSDAAAVLRAMNRLTGKPLTERVMLSLAAALGSDVPFCYVGKTAICEGRGEILSRLDTARNFFLVIAKGHEYVPTPMAFGELDRVFSDFDGSVFHDASKTYETLLSYLTSDAPPPVRLYNIFEEVIFPCRPIAAQLKELLTAYGATLSLMSGSGPAVFGIFEKEEQARLAKEKLRAQGYLAFTASSV